MSNNIDLKELWSQQESEMPDASEIFIKAKQFKQKHLRKIIYANALLIATSVFIIFIWDYFQPQFLTTKIGIILTIAAMVLFLFVYNQTIPLLLKSNYEMDSTQFLSQLLKLKEKQLFLQNTMLKMYFILLSAGIGLYMIEYVSRMNWLRAILSYGITILWMAVNWFYFRPKTIKKQQTQLKELIDKFENLTRQLDIKE